MAIKLEHCSEVDRLIAQVGLHAVSVPHEHMSCISLSVQGVKELRDGEREMQAKQQQGKESQKRRG